MSTINTNDITVHNTNVIDTLYEHVGETLSIGVILNIIAGIDIKERENNEVD